MKKILAVVLALAMVLGLGTVAFAKATETVTIYGDSTVVAGGTANFTALLLDEDSAAPDSDNTVTWTVTGQKMAATTIDSTNGTLTVAADETAASLTVTATTPAAKTANKVVAVTKAPALPTLKVIEEPKLSVAVTGTTFGTKSTDKFYINVSITNGTYYMDANNNGKQDSDEPTLTATITLADGSSLTITDDKSNTYTAANNVGGIYTVSYPGTVNADASKMWITMPYTRTYGADGTSAVVYNETIEKKVDEKPQQEIQDGLDEAVKNKSTIATFEITNLTNQTVSAADWAYITNTWKGTKWYDNFNYLGMTLRFVNSDTNTIFTINASDLDYTWTKPVDFRETTGLVKYDKTEAEMYNVIRAITGDTKNPYTFGFSQMDNTKDRGTSVPKMTISKVVPQQWINYYGHKNVNLFAWDAGISCDNWAHNDPKVLAETTLDATTLTQRIEFTTNDLYKTLVLAAKATTTDAEKPAGDKTDDANPNTGANDIVNVAIVFAVVSLAAAGAFVFKKAK